MALIDQPESSDVPPSATPAAQLTAETVAAAPTMPPQQQHTAQAGPGLPALPQTDHPASFHLPTPATPSGRSATATTTMPSLQHTAQAASGMAGRQRPTIQQQTRRNSSNRHSARMRHRAAEAARAAAERASQPVDAGEEDDAEDAVSGITPSRDLLPVPDFHLEEPSGRLVPLEHQQPLNWLYPNGELGRPDIRGTMSNIYAAGAEFTVTMGSGQAGPAPSQHMDAQDTPMGVSDAQHAAHGMLPPSSQNEAAMTPPPVIDGLYFGNPVSDPELSLQLSRIPAPAHTQRRSRHIRFRTMAPSARERSRRMVQPHAVPARSRFFGGPRLNAGNPRPTTSTDDPWPTEFDPAADFQFADPQPATTSLMQHGSIQMAVPQLPSPYADSQPSVPAAAFPPLLAAAATPSLQHGNLSHAQAHHMSPYPVQQLSVPAPPSSTHQHLSLASTAAATPNMQDGSLPHAQANAMFPDPALARFVHAQASSAPQQYASASTLDPALDMQNGSLPHAQAHAMSPPRVPQPFAPPQTDSAPNQLTLSSPRIHNGRLVQTDAETMPPMSMPQRPALSQPSSASLPSSSSSAGPSYSHQQHANPALAMQPFTPHYPPHPYQQHRGPLMAAPQPAPQYPVGQRLNFAVRGPDGLLRMGQAEASDAPQIAQVRQQQPSMPLNPVGRRLNFTMRRPDGGFSWGEAEVEALGTPQIPQIPQIPQQLAPAQAQIYPATSSAKRKGKQPQKRYHWED